MKEHFQDYGVRKWAGDDLIELQSEPLAALQALVSPYAPCIVSGCETALNDAGGYTVSAGLVALAGKDAKGNDCVKIVRANGITLADTNQVCYLTLGHQTLTRTYMDGQSKAIAYDYMAQQSTTPPQDVPYLEITANGGRRLVDTLGITQKLNSEGGEAKDVKVTFADPLPQKMEDIASGTKLGVLISNIKAWLLALKAMAFKEKVSKDDLDADLTKELDSKVNEEKGKVLSSNDFTDGLKEKLKNIDDEANKYTHPAYTPRTGSTGNMTPGFGETAYTYTYNVDNQGHVTGQNTRTIKIPDTPASETAAGLMSADDKAKLNGIAKNANNFTYSHPTGNGNNHIPKDGSSGQYLKYSSSGTATWAKPTASEIGAAESSHTHTLSSLGAAATSEATQSANGLMSAADKTKLDGIAKNANNFTYTHPALQHIPSGGSSGQYLKYSSSGTAAWTSPASNLATTSAAGFMSSSDKKKLDEIPVSISVKGKNLIFTWVTNTTATGTPTNIYTTYTYETDATSSSR